MRKLRPTCEHVAFVPVGSTGSHASTTSEGPSGIVHTPPRTAKDRARPSAGGRGIAAIKKPGDLGWQRIAIAAEAIEP
jgi:hypothetical protein